MLVVVVPKKTKCRSGVDTIMEFETTGAFAITEALTDVALVKSASHSKHFPPTIKAISFEPKLSKDHRPGSITESASRI